MTLNVELWNKSLDSNKYFINGKWELFKSLVGFGGQTLHPINGY